MNKSDQEAVMQIFILAMGGEDEYNLSYHYPISPLLVNMGIKTADFCKFLIKQYDDTAHQDLNNGKSSASGGTSG